MKVYNENGQVLFPIVHSMTTFFQRLLGVSRLDNIADTDAYFFDKCSSVHMFGVRATIDVIFLDKNTTVTKIARSLRPWRAAGAWGARSVLEVADGMSQRLDIQVGQTLIIK